MALDSDNLKKFDVSQDVANAAQASLDDLMQKFQDLQIMSFQSAGAQVKGKDDYTVDPNYALTDQNPMDKLERGYDDAVLKQVEKDAPYLLEDGKLDKESAEKLGYTSVKDNDRLMVTFPDADAKQSFQEKVIEPNAAIGLVANPGLELKAKTGKAGIEAKAAPELTNAPDNVSQTPSMGSKS